MKMLPNWIGFDSLFNELDRMVSTKLPTWPPYNVRKVDDNHYVIELAVAGFGRSDLDLEMNGNELLIKGSMKSEGGEYLHKGIAERAFNMKFPLADTIKVQNADLVNGMLKIWLENFIPESKQPKKIAISE
jgi:molecular chaperone IbpA